MSRTKFTQSVPLTAPAASSHKRRSLILTVILAVAITIALFAGALALVHKIYPAATPVAPVAEEYTLGQSEKTKSGGEQQNFNVDELPPEPEIIEGGNEGEYSWTDAPLDPAVEELLNDDLVINGVTSSVQKDNFVGDLSRVSLQGTIGVEAIRDPELLFMMLQTLTENFCFNEIRLTNPYEGPTLTLSKACGGSDDQTQAYLEIWEEAIEHDMQQVIFEWDSAKLSYRDYESTNLALLSDDLKDFQNTDWEGFDYTQIAVGDAYGHYDFALAPGQTLEDAIEAQAPWRQESD